MKHKSQLSCKHKKNVINLSSAEYAQRVAFLLTIVAVLQIFCPVLSVPIASRK